MQPVAGPSTVVLTEKRGLKACTACRIAKVRCHIIPDTGICVRCQSAAIPCKFTTTRRGRVKGSKNRKTLEKLASSNGDAVRTTSSPISSVDHTLEAPWSTGDQTSLRDPVSSFELPDGNRNGSTMTRAQSPLDPFMSGLSALTSPTPVPQRISDGKARPTRQSMTRRTVQTMAGSFPTGSEHAVSDSIPRADFSTGRDMHNPLLFLAECARRGWDTAESTESRETMAVPVPNTNLPLEDAIRLGRWSKENLGKIIGDQKKYFQHGLHGTKRDVSIGLDPVYQGVIKEEQVATLFASYFYHVHSQWGILDRDVHTPAFVRSRSVFLFTVILALGATSIATLSTSTSQDRVLAIKLWAHLEKLQLVVCATAAKSVEIVQGMLLAQMWALRSPRLVDDQRATRLGMATRMASQIGLQLSKQHNNHSGEQRNLNDLRTRLSLVLVENRWESIADRQEIACHGFDLTDFEAEELDCTGPLEDNALMAADYALYRFEAESKERISRISQSTRSSIAMDSERIWIRTYLSAWNSKWVDPQTDPLHKWWFRYLSIRSRLVGILRVAKARVHPGPWTDQMKADLVSVSTELLEGCLSHERAMHMLRPTSPIVFAAAILLQLTSKDAPERDLILRVALRLAGAPRQEDIMTYAVHNGYQILNMLCLSREATNIQSRPGPVVNSINSVYDQPSVSASNHSLQSQDHSYTQHMQAAPSVDQRFDPISSLSNQPFDDIDQLLGLSGNNGNGGGIDLSQWSGLNTNVNHNTNTNTTNIINPPENLSNNVWSNFLSTDPMTSNEFPAVPMPDQNGYMAWGDNGGEDPFNLAGGRQMSDNDISDFYFHLASALGS